MADTDPDPHPDRPAARRRAVRLRPVEGPPRAGRRARRGRRDVPGHLAPAVDRARAGRPAAGRAAPSCSRSRTATRSCCPTAASTAFWDAATFGLVRQRSQHLVVRRVRRRSSPTAVADAPFLGAPTVDRVRARRRAGVLGRDRRRRVRQPAQRDVDRGRRRGPPGRPAPTTARSCCGTRRPAAGGLPGRRDRGGRLLLRAAEELRLRRRAVGRADEPGGARPHRARSRRPAAGSPPSSTSRSRSSSPASTRRTTPRRSRRSS